MFKEKWDTKKNISYVLSCILIMLLVFCLFFSYTFAWLSGKVDKSMTGTTNLATIPDNPTKLQKVVEVVMPQAGSYKDVSDNEEMKITNEGSIDALVRVFYSITINDETKQIATTKDFSKININSGFVASEENIDNVYSGYYFYNQLLAPNQSVGLINRFYPTSTIAGKTVKINFYYELVNYVGGPYQLGQELPWRNTPAFRQRR